MLIKFIHLLTKQNEFNAKKLITFKDLDEKSIFDSK